MLQDKSTGVMDLRKMRKRRPWRLSNAQKKTSRLFIIMKKITLMVGKDIASFVNHQTSMQSYKEHPKVHRMRCLSFKFQNVKIQLHNRHVQIHRKLMILCQEFKWKLGLTLKRLI